MSEERPQAGEATEPASERKLKQARQRGEVAKSKELVSWAVFSGVCVAISWSWPLVFARLHGDLRRVLINAPQYPERVSGALQIGLDTLTFALLPVLAAAVLFAVVGNFAQTGPLLTFAPVKPKLKRLDPISNAKQILGKQAGLELLKSVVKIVGAFCLAAFVIWDHAPRLLGTLGRSPNEGLSAVALCLGALALRLGIFFACVGFFDLVVQRYAFAKKMRMTKEEVKREHRESEGDPHHRAERQRLHREISEHRMMERVATADCLVVNPTRLATALKYDGKEDQAPRVMAQGQRLVAARMREIARQHGVPIVRDVPLANALVELELDDEIPEDLYQAVAEILRFVYRVRQGEVAAANDVTAGPDNQSMGSNE